MSFTRACVFLLVVFSLILGACASKNHVSQEYQESLRGRTERTSKRTVLLFLIDGLPVSTLQEQLEARRLPNIKNYFQAHSQRIYLARTPFPSLTFPGIGSPLTEKPLDQNGLYGNLVLQDGEPLNLESPANYLKLNQMIKGDNVFARLRAKGLKTVSIDYGFRADTDASMDANDSEAALAILNKDYARVDGKLIESLRSLLSDTYTSRWPDFIFVHLIGVDFLSHDFGPKSQEVAKYLRFLDQELGSTLKAL